MRENGKSRRLETAAKKSIPNLVCGGLLSCLALILWACSGDEDGPIGTGEKPALVKGTAQKGPFVRDSEVIINPLNTRGQRTDTTINTKTIDDFGRFDFASGNETIYDIAIHGIHFNELSGTLSSQPITLHAIYIKTTMAASNVYINVLTHIINQRILYLLRNGETAASALQIAQDELLFFIHDAIFIIKLENISFNNLSIYNLQDADLLGNALLLYVSATLYQTATTRSLTNNSDVSFELGNLLAAIADDLETDGKIDELALIQELRDATYLLNPDTIENNLITYSSQILGKALTVPDMNSVLDTDRDGLVNDIDLDDDGDGMPDTEDDNPYRFDIITQKNIAVSVSAGGKIVIPWNFNRPEIRPIMVLDIDLPQLGTIEGYAELGVLRGQIYTANIDSSGTDTFSYHVVSNSLLFGNYTSETTTVSIKITPAQ